MATARSVGPFLAATAQVGAGPVRGVLRRAERALHGPAGASSAALSARPSEVLTDDREAREARSRAYRMGLPHCHDASAAWAALGALAAVLRLADDGHRSAIVGDASGTRSPFRRWARWAGFAALPIDLADPSGRAASLDVEPGSLDVLTRLHPGGAEVDNADALLADAARLLRPRGLAILTVPLGPSEDGAMGAAEVRGLVARAAGLGLDLVGTLAPADYARVREAASANPDGAYGLARLTFVRA